MEISNIQDIQYWRARLDFNNTSSHSHLSNVTRTQHFNRAERREQKPILKYFCIILNIRLKGKSFCIHMWRDLFIFLFVVVYFLIFVKTKDDPFEGSWGCRVYFPPLVVQDFNQTLWKQADWKIPLGCLKTKHPTFHVKQGRWLFVGLDHTRSWWFRKFCSAGCFIAPFQKSDLVRVCFLYLSWIWSEPSCKLYI